MILFPRLLRTRNAQIRYRKAAQTRLRLAATPGRALITNLAARTGRRTGKRRNRRRMVMRLHLHQNMNIFFMRTVHAIRIREKPPATRTLDHRSIVLVGRQNPLRRVMVGIANHAKQTLGLRLPVNHPIGIENLVTAMLRVGLRKHHQLDIRGIALKVLEIFQQIINFVLGQRQPPILIGLRQGRTATAEHIHRAQGLGFSHMKQHSGIVQRRQHRFRHPIMQSCIQHRTLPMSERLSIGSLHAINHTALNAMNHVQSAVMRNIRRLGCPRRNRPRTRNHHTQLIRKMRTACMTVIQHRLKLTLLDRTQTGLNIHKMHKLRGNRRNLWLIMTQTRQQFT